MILFPYTFCKIRNPIISASNANIPKQQVTEGYILNTFLENPLRYSMKAKRGKKSFRKSISRFDLRPLSAFL